MPHSSPPVLRLRPVGGCVRSNPDGTATFLDFTFICRYADQGDNTAHAGINFGGPEMLLTAPLGEAGYRKICELLAKQAGEQIDG